nr:MAG TPA: hypothetical protein [Caudoviricetes sp.]
MNFILHKSLPILNGLGSYPRRKRLNISIEYV